MKKIFLIIFLYIFLIFPKNIFADEIENWNIEPTAENQIEENEILENIEKDNKTENDLTEFILKRKDRIEELLNKSSDNQAEKTLNEIKENLNSKITNTEISNEFIKNLQEQFETLNKAIEEKNQEIQNLNAKDSEKTKQEIRILESEKTELETKINVEKNKILALETEIAELEIYKSRYENLVKENYDEKIKEREKNLLIYLIIFWIYLIASWAWLRIKNSQSKSIFNVVSLAIFIISTVIFTLVINPGFMIIFIIIAWSIVLTFKDFIVSFISSILILRRYKIWDLVEIEWKKWKINSISALNTTLLTNTWEIFLLNNFLISKPLKLIENEDENTKIKIFVSKNELKNKIKNIKNIFKNDELKMHFTEKDDEKIEIEIEIDWIKVTEKIEKIF